MITLQCKLEFKTPEEEKEVLKLMQNFSSCVGYAYNRLLEGAGRKELKKTPAESILSQFKIL
jgi:predicted transposase